MGAIKGGYPKGRAPETRAPSLEDKLQREAEQAGGDAIGDWLLGRNINRPIRALSRDELRFMAAAAIAAWLGKRTEQESLERPRPSFLEGG